MKCVAEAVQKLYGRFNGCRTVFKYPDKQEFVKFSHGISMKVPAKVFLT